MTCEAIMSDALDAAIWVVWRALIACLTMAAIQGARGDTVSELDDAWERAKLDAAWELAKQAKGTPQTPPEPRTPPQTAVYFTVPLGWHRHHCEHCNVTWTHPDDVRGVETAHACPECNRLVWGVYTGSQRPLYADTRHPAFQKAKSVPVQGKTYIEESNRNPPIYTLRETATGKIILSYDPLIDGNLPPVWLPMLVPNEKGGPPVKPVSAAMEYCPPGMD
jgi:hypothetical protein